MERRSEIHTAHADVGGHLQNTRVPNSQPPPQMAAQGDCDGRPTTKNHSMAVNHGPGPGQRPRSGEPTDHATSIGRSQGVQIQTTDVVNQPHGCAVKHDATVGAPNGVNDADQTPPEDDHRPVNDYHQQALGSTQPKRTAPRWLTLTWTGCRSRDAPRR